MIIKIKCDDESLDDCWGRINNRIRCLKDGTYLWLDYKIHKTTTAKQVEYVVEKIDTATASELAQRCNNIQRKYAE